VSEEDRTADRVNPNHVAQITENGDGSAKKMGQIRLASMARPEEWRGEEDGSIWRFLASALRHRVRCTRYQRRNLSFSL